MRALGWVVGVPILLSGTDLTGAAISKSTTVSFPMVRTISPNWHLGTISCRGSHWHLLTTPETTVNIQSGVSDGDMVSNLNISGSLKVGYFDIRDFLGSTNKNSLTVVEADGTAHLDRSTWRLGSTHYAAS
ncbi:MAG: hypothetical protein R3C56_04270 [Pirellulaceae bacterium]